MKNFRIAVKAFIIKDNKLLLLRRRSDDAHSPGKWDIPGGRLDIGENPFLGMKREAKEETGLDIEIKLPLDIQHFTRDDGQEITMIIFLCEPTSDNIKLSEEHQEFKWVDVGSPKEVVPDWLRVPLENYLRYSR